MLSRREFAAGAATAVAAPYVLKRQASAQAAQPPRVRRDVQALDNSDPFFAKYGEAVSKMHDLSDSDLRKWRNQALIHLKHCVHDGLDFPHWHRHYIANFEAICAKLIGDPQFALPYWNWSANSGRIPDPFYDNNFLNVGHWRDPSNASDPNWFGGSLVETVGRRGLRKGQGLQDQGGGFTEEEIGAIQRQSVYELYTGQIEGGPHGSAHVISGGDTGHMSDGMSALDPIFWLHHCNVDRLWAQWQAAGNIAPALDRNYSGNFVDENAQPVADATSANALDTARFNYTYDVLTDPMVIAAAKRLQLQPAQSQTALRTEPILARPQTLGIERVAKTVALRTPTSFSVMAPDLIPNLFKVRTFWAPNPLGVRRLAAEAGRVVAKLSNVTPPLTKVPMIVNVFINSPDLSPETKPTDPHYAGSFSFFGRGHGASHGASHGGTQFFVDVTKPLQRLAGEGRIATDRVNVQLLAVPVGDAAPQSTFTVGSIELLRT